LGELFAKDALHRNESCGGHFREDQTDGEATRDDENFARSCMGVQGKPSDAVLQRGIGFDNVKLVVVINSN
jgi:succinate dehydrogenase / fumarate reductase flavoprotein subunit